MVKLKKPLFSQSASGTLADKVTYINVGTVPHAKFKQKKPVAKTSAQVSLRDLFKTAATLAKELTPGEKVYYAALSPNSASCPWWNNFIGKYIKDHWGIVGISLKSFQSGTINPGVDKFYPHTITEVDHTKSIILNLGNYSVASDLVSSFCSIKLENETTINLSRYGTQVGLLVGYMVIEFDGLLRDVDHFRIICDEVDENYVDLPSFNVDKSLIFFGGIHTASSDYKSVCARLWIDSNTRIRTKFGTSSSFKRIHGCLLAFP